jgi:putative membrane protein
MNMQKKSNNFFTSEESSRISDTIKTVELRTSGEVAVMVVDQSDEYPDAAVIGGVLLSSLFSFIITTAFFHGEVWSYIPVNFALFFPFYILSKKTLLLKARLIGKGRKERAVHLRALRAFYEKGLHLTKEQTGVLFFISIFEHKVWVLADKGIYDKITQDTLNAFALKVSQGIKDGRSCDVLCEEIRNAGDLLAKYFPITSGDENELTNEIIQQ